MHKKNIITISGKPGSGKSTTADSLAEILSYARYSAGQVVRKYIIKNKLTLREYNERAVLDHSLDQNVDQKIRALRTQNDLVIDSRLGFYWIPESFKVYLDLDIKIASQRIYNDAEHNTSRRNSGEKVNDLADAEILVKERMELEQRRFQALYHIDPYQLKHFDLIINTLNQTPQSVSLQIHNSYKKWLISETWEPAVVKQKA